MSARDQPLLCRALGAMRMVSKPCSAGSKSIRWTQSDLIKALRKHLAGRGPSTYGKSTREAFAPQARREATNILRFEIVNAPPSTTQTLIKRRWVEDMA